jgi:hypothetical protein
MNMQIPDARFIRDFVFLNGVRSNTNALRRQQTLLIVLKAWCILSMLAHKPEEAARRIKF